MELHTGGAVVTCSLFFFSFVFWTVLSFSNMDLETNLRMYSSCFCSNLPHVFVSGFARHQKPSRRVKMLCTVIIRHYGNFSIFNRANVKPEGASFKKYQWRKLSSSQVRNRQSHENLQKSRRFEFKLDL